MESVESLTLVVAAAVSVGGVAVFTWLMRTASADVQRVRGQPRALAVSAKPGMVHLRGRVSAERTTARVEGPLGAPGVFVRVVLERLASKTATDGRGGTTAPEVLDAAMAPEWIVLHREDRCVPFLLDDGSGASVAVDLTGAKVVIDRREDAVSRPDALDPRVLAIARARLPDEPVESMNLRLTVQTFVEGDEISILGMAEELGASSVDPYRTATEAARVRVVRPSTGSMLASHSPLSELADTGRLNVAE